MPTPNWKVNYGGRTRWRAGDNINMAIGQGDVLVTPLQLANGYATFANGGTRYVPQIALKAVSNQTGEVTQEFTPTVAGQVDLPAEVREPLLQGLLGVPRSGTATRVSPVPAQRLPDRGQDRHGAGERQIRHGRVQRLRSGAGAPLSGVGVPGGVGRRHRRRAVAWPCSRPCPA